MSGIQLTFRASDQLYCKKPFEMSEISQPTLSDAALRTYCSQVEGLNLAMTFRSGISKSIIMQFGLLLR